MKVLVRVSDLMVLVGALVIEGLVVEGLLVWVVALLASVGGLVVVSVNTLVERSILYKEETE